MSQTNFVLIAAASAALFTGSTAGARISDTASADKTVESNYIINPKGCMGLGDTPETDGLMLVLTFNEKGRVTPDGKVVVPKDSAYLVVSCASKPELEKCQSQRAVFKIEASDGPYSLPTSRHFSCTKM